MQTHSEEASDVTLMLMGDTNVQNREDPAGAYRHVLSTLQEADLRFTNLEGPFAGTSKDPLVPDIPHKQGWRHSEPEMVKGLTAAGIDVVGVANNVTYPWRALLRSLEVLDENGIQVTGGGEDLDDAHRPAIAECKGVRIGFLQYTATFWPYDHAAMAHQPGVATVKVDTQYRPPRQVLDKPGQPPEVVTEPDAQALERMTDDIRQLDQRADVVVASYHWGLSNVFDVVDYQRTLGRAAIDAGADLVIGHGPHVLQPVELWQGKPIFFSLANFVFDWEKARKTPNGLLVRVTISDGALAGVSCLPVQRDDANDPVILNPAEGEGRKLFERLVELGGETGASLALKNGEIAVEGIEAAAQLHPQP